MTQSFQPDIEKEFHNVIEDAWHRTILDFQKAGNQNAIWNEATLRLNFLRRLSEVCKINDITLDRILGETKIHFRKEKYKPDLILDVKIKDETFRIGFEMKYFGKIENWKRDLQKLDNYLFRNWNFRYYLAIGKKEQCIEIEKALLDNKVKILTQIMPRQNVSSDVFLGSVIENIFGKEADYVPSDEPVARVHYSIEEDWRYIFWFWIDDDKLVVDWEIPDRSEEIFTEISKYYEIDKENEELYHSFKICEFALAPSKTYYAKAVANKLREPINQFIQKMDILIKNED